MTLPKTLPMDHIRKQLETQDFVWDRATVFLSDPNPLIPTHKAKNGKLCIQVDNRFVYTKRREDGGYDAVGEINLPATPVKVIVLPEPVLEPAAV